MAAPSDDRPNPSEEIGRWLEAARQGSPEALGRALDACRPYLLCVARKNLCPDLLAKLDPADIVQETFLHAQRAFAGFPGRTETDLLAWLRRILLNHLANQTRRFRDTDKRQVGREVSLWDDSAVGQQDPAVAPPDTPSSQAMARETAGQIEWALEQLPDHYRRVIRWHHWERHSFEEIGRQLGRSAEAVRKLWARAIEQLGQLLEPPHES